MKKERRNSENVLFPCHHHTQFHGRDRYENVTEYPVEISRQYLQQGVGLDESDDWPRGREKLLYSVFAYSLYGSIMEWCATLLRTDYQKQIRIIRHFYSTRDDSKKKLKEKKN